MKIDAGRVAEEVSTIKFPEIVLERERMSNVPERNGWNEARIKLIEEIDNIMNKGD